MEITQTTTMSIDGIIKNLTYIPVFILGLPIESFGILTAFIIGDMVTGIAKSWIINGKKSITSRRFAIGLLSKLSMLCVPLLVAAAGRGAGIDLTFLARGALSLLIFSEGYSIIGNMISIRTGKDTHEFDAVTHVLMTIQGFMLKYVTETKEIKKED